MKDKDRAFFEALDILKANGVEPVGAALMQDHELMAVKQFGPEHLKGWRRWFWKERIVLEGQRVE